MARSRKPCRGSVSLIEVVEANTIVFGVAKTVLLRPLGYGNEDRLIWIRRIDTRSGAPENQVSWQEMEDIRALMTESVVLAMAGGMAGLALASGGLQVIRNLATGATGGPDRRGAGAAGLCRAAAGELPPASGAGGL